MLADVLGYLRCPHCAGRLALSGDVVRCDAGHAFDVARQGYVSLLPGTPRAARGDTAEMLVARDAFIGAGHLEPLGSALVKAAGHVAAEGCVLDLGAGSGWQLARVLDALPERHGVALDVSSAALRRAARAHPRIGAAGCDIWGALPVRDAAAALALNVFAPRNGAETTRVLAPGGLLAVVTPTERHLEELVGPLGLLGMGVHKRERLRRELGGLLEHVSSEVREWRMVLTPADLEALARMGPSAFHLDPAKLRARIEALPEPVEAGASVTVTVWRRP